MTETPNKIQEIEVLYNSNNTDIINCLNAMNFLREQLDFAEKKYFSFLDQMHFGKMGDQENDNGYPYERIFTLNNDEFANYCVMLNKIKYLGLDTLIKLSSEYIICHSSVLKLSSHMNQWYKNERKVNNYFRPENSDEKSKLIHNFGKKREEFKKIPRKLSFYELDLSEYDHQAVAIVVKAMYNGKLEYPKDKKMAVMRMVKNFKMEKNCPLAQLYDESITKDQN